MTKYFILNILLTLAIVFLAYTALQIFLKSSYGAADFVIAGLAIAFLVVLVYLKIVLTKKVKSVIQEKDAQRKKQIQPLSSNRSGRKSGKK